MRIVVLTGLLLVAGSALTASGPPAARGASVPEDTAAVVHLLNRATFGPRPGDVERVQLSGITAWVETQLHPERIEDGALEARLSRVAAEADQAEVHIRPNKLVEYKSVATVLASAQRLGVTKLGMIGNEQFVK